MEKTCTFLCIIKRSMKSINMNRVIMIYCIITQCDWYWSILIELLGVATAATNNCDTKRNSFKTLKLSSQTHQIWFYVFIFIIFYSVFFNGSLLIAVAGWGLCYTCKRLQLALADRWSQITDNDDPSVRPSDLSPHWGNDHSVLQPRGL